jgi:hypothetical protein
VALVMEVATAGRRGGHGLVTCRFGRRFRSRTTGYDAGRAPVAQWIERHRPKVRVGGSSPSGGATRATPTSVR